jgi:alpha-beta hydrolase superfamily lysophospholipase
MSSAGPPGLTDMNTLANTDIHTVTSLDGTTITYERSGSGPVVVLVGGAFCDRQFAGPLTGHLAQDFTVVNYDRRGRGDSGDTPPYAARREIEDLHTVIDASGGSAYVYGVSSGAMLALDAAAEGVPIRKLALCEPPYTVDDTRPLFRNYADDYTRLCASGQRGEAVELFMTKAVGQPAEAAEQMRKTPMWAALEAMAHTLAYDATIVGDAALPVARAATVTVPALGIESSTSPQWLRSAARAIATALPNGTHVTIEGQFHQPDPALLAAALTQFFRA